MLDSASFAAPATTQATKRPLTVDARHVEAQVGREQAARSFAREAYRTHRADLETPAAVVRRVRAAA
jgi:hypothetical protein